MAETAEDKDKAEKLAVARKKVSTDWYWLFGC
jgi:hypothetical protein